MKQKEKIPKTHKESGRDGIETGSVFLRTFPSTFDVLKRRLKQAEVAASSGGGGRRRGVAGLRRRRAPCRRALPDPAVSPFNASPRRVANVASIGDADRGRWGLTPPLLKINNRGSLFIRAHFSPVPARNNHLGVCARVTESESGRTRHGGDGEEEAEREFAWLVGG